MQLAIDICSQTLQGSSVWPRRRSTLDIRSLHPQCGQRAQLRYVSFTTHFRVSGNNAVCPNRHIQCVITYSLCCRSCRKCWTASKSRPSIGASSTSTLARKTATSAMHTSRSIALNKTLTNHHQNRATLPASQPASPPKNPSVWLFCLCVFLFVIMKLGSLSSNGVAIASAICFVHIILYVSAKWWPDKVRPSTPFFLVIMWTLVWMPEIIKSTKYIYISFEITFRSVYYSHLSLIMFLIFAYGMLSSINIRSTFYIVREV